MFRIRWAWVTNDHSSSIVKLQRIKLSTALVFDKCNLFIYSHCIEKCKL